jgi:hypothetical protein
VTDKYVEWLHETDDEAKKESLKSSYEMFMKEQSKLYLVSLDLDTTTQIPEPRSWLRGLRKFFLKNK